VVRKGQDFRVFQNGLLRGFHLDAFYYFAAYFGVFLYFVEFLRGQSARLAQYVVVY
jgi:hypothetical protein